MKQARLIALRKLKYGTRRLQAGDLFDATAGDARVLTVVGRARVADVEEQPDDEVSLDALRARADALGVHVDRRWGEARLLDEIDTAKQR